MFNFSTNCDQRMAVQRKRLRIRMIIAVSGHDGVFKLCFNNNGSLARWQLNKLFKACNASNVTSNIS